jgi:hypothetical protein
MVSKQNIGNAGEYFIAYLLSAKDCIVTVTLGRNEGFDLLLVNPKNKTFKISVKTTLYNEKSLLITEKAEEVKDPDFYYAFIRLNNFNKLPDYWIVPSKIVANVINYYHQKYIKTLKKDGTPRKNLKMRKFFLVNDKNYPPNWVTTLDQYKNNIDLLLN